MVGAGPRNEAKRLVTEGAEIVKAVAAGEGIDRPRVLRLVEHGITRNVDTQVRQVAGTSDVWDTVGPDQVQALVAVNPGMEVLLGAHRNGYVRQTVLERRSGEVLPGIARMLAQRAVDGIPPVRALAQQHIAALFSAEIAEVNDGRMPTNVEKAARELVGLTRSVTLCPTELLQALNLFSTRVGRYSRHGARDHHRHDLRETDRRAQLLDDVQLMLTTLTEPAEIEAATQLITFYEASLVPAARVVVEDPLN